MNDYDVIVIGAGLGGISTTVASGLIASRLIDKYEQH